MAQKKKTKKQKKQQEQLRYIFIGIFFICFSLLGLLKLGYLGILIANGLRLVVGNTFTIAAVLLMLYGFSLVLFGENFPIKSARPIIGGLLIYLGVLLFLHVYWFRNIGSGSPNIINTTWDFLKMDLSRSTIAENIGGGMIGAGLYTVTHFLVAQLGSYAVAVVLILTGSYLISMLEIQQLLDGIQKFRKVLGMLFAKSDEHLAARAEKRAEQKKMKEAEKQERAREMAEQWLEKNQVREHTPGEHLAQTEREQYDYPEQEPEQLTLVPIDSFQSQEQERSEPHYSQEEIHYNEQEEAGDLDFDIAAEAEDRDYQLPFSTLLDSVPVADQSGEYKKIEKNISVLEQTFKSFGVDAQVVKASLGPAVTKFEVQPAVGVKVSKIVGLTDDIALALAAKDVRMEAPIPGKSLIGIEVPNSTVSTVSFRDVIDAQPSHPDKILEVPLGRDISGVVQSADLTKMPHLLIAGSTGSGKSVAINGIITSILMRAKPHEVKMMMIDPKMVELNVYNGIPHLLTPVVTNPRKAAQALQKVVQEMEFRYEKFAAAGVRNISGYNELVIQKNLEDGENRPILPFIVVIVDELADLMMVASNEVEDAIIRLAQMARAAGIHMILATQRPSVDVITGIIKANVPSRIAFAVSSGTDSRTIIDSNGAEKLLGRGDMLFLPMGENKPIRVQGAFISDHEVERVVSFVTEQQEADYQEDMMPTEEAVSGSSENPQDELYGEAKALVIEMQTASISLLQRRFRIGYNRAARLVDELEANHVIGPSEGSKPRKVFVEVEEEEEVQPPEHDQDY
ncbi:DNA translocase FtsK [Enterococcus sp. BWT-B8]|uniref:DNA translocase FtsK n=1 Tax=Enterococcus sp. BWT-B8 TaxID=2885157 RepID=UPI001E58F8D6|nr:DNA translocase FtsK [Enterococcus sp. BWT-B8]MCB5951954.1 DNA translocase FtsK [Enterococcus sp. BWT-B8]